MGMSASQMRYALISGKKSDVEYEGQQINQERTSLATETSAYNTQLLTLEVPTPPTSTEYTTTTYTFPLNSKTCTLSNLSYNDANDNTYTVNYTYEAVEDTARKATKSIYQDASGKSYINGDALEAIPAAMPADLTGDEQDEWKSDVANLNLIYDKYENNKANETYYKYVSGGETYYLNQTEIDTLDQKLTTAKNPGGITQDPLGNNITCHYVEEDATVTKSETYNNAKISWSDTGRIETVTDDDGNTYTVSCGSTEDTAGYNDALNEYEYKKGEYNQTMKEINAQIEIIEQQDKKLELKLQNLDTQQEALSTEMDAVKKVIDKNIEKSFNVFG